MVYVKFAEGTVGRTVPWQHSKTGQIVNIDLDDNGGLVGVEFVGVLSTTVEGEFSRITENFDNRDKPTTPTRIEVEK